MAKEQTITVPDIGNNKDVSIIEVLVKPGDVIKKEDSLITLESDKAAMEIPSSHAGVVKGVIAKVGDKHSQGSPILVLVEEEAGTEPVAAAEPEPAAASAPTAPPAGLRDDAEDTVTVPDIGNNKDVSVIEVLVKVGDIIKPEDSIITLESDKAAMEIPSPKGGEVKQVLIKVGDKVSRGSPVLVLAGATGGSAPVPVQAKPATAPVAAPAVAAPAPTQSMATTWPRNPSATTSPSEPASAWNWRRQKISVNR